jgi:ArsR family transcriptional regulator, virulence genes transcriptional regulator
MIKPVLSSEIQKSAERQAMLCRVFRNAQRILVLWLLAEKERTVSQIASAVGASLPGTSQHLRLMELSPIVESRREHHNIFCQIANHELLNNCLVLTNRPKQRGLETEEEG